MAKSKIEAHGEDERAKTPEENPERPKDVRIIEVAISDTGIDHKHPTVQILKAEKRFDEANGCYKSFVGEHAWRSCDTEDATQDMHGHGTHTTVLLATAAARAQSYIVKIAETESTPAKNLIAEVI